MVRVRGCRIQSQRLRWHGIRVAQGPVGLMATAGARLLGAGLVIAIESVPKRQGAMDIESRIVGGA